MNNKCFTKIYDAVADNNSLRAPGEFLISVKTGNSFTTVGRDYYFKIANADTPDSVVVTRCKNVILYDNNGQELTIPTLAKNVSYAYSPNGGEVYIGDKYNFNFIESYVSSEFELDEYFKNLVYFRHYGTSSLQVNLKTFSDFQYIKEIQLVSSETTVYGDLSDLEELTTLIKISCSSFGKNLGNISSLNKLTSLTNLNTAGSTAVTVVGIVENLCEAQITNGRTSGTLDLNVRKPGITLHGVAVKQAVITFSDSGCSVVGTLSESSTTFTATYDGTNWTYSE